MPKKIIKLLYLSPEYKIMQSAMQKNFNKLVCDQIFGSSSEGYWKNYIGCCNRDMKHFYRMVGGDSKRELNLWAIQFILEAEDKILEEVGIEK